MCFPAGKVCEPVADGLPPHSHHGAASVPFASQPYRALAVMLIPPPTVDQLYGVAL